MVVEPRVVGRSTNLARLDSNDLVKNWSRQRCGRELGAVLLVELADGVSHMLHQGGGLRMCVNRDWD